MSKRTFGIALACCFLFAVPLRSDPSVAPEIPAGDQKTYLLSQAIFQFGNSIAQDGDEVSAALQLAEESIEYFLPGFGEDLPEWMKRIEFEFENQEENKPEWSILTVQPLWESEDLKDTVFTQLSFRQYELFNRHREVLNGGLGYRRLLFDNSVLVGFNGFYDYEFDFNHQRSSIGFEAKWAGFDLSANRYWGLSDEHTAGSAAVTEEPLDGHDIELTAQLPYLPWARVRGKRYWWQTQNLSEDIKGWSASVEMDLLQNLQFEAGVTDDNYIEEKEYFAQARLTFLFGRPVAMSNSLVSDNPWLMRDMSEYRLDKVRRENKIIVERRSSGVVITRGG